MDADLVKEMEKPLALNGLDILYIPEEMQGNGQEVSDRTGQ
jgi:hypothetical protein